ncbi:MAG TPA: hypothetical protein IAC62_13730 [Candidatus Pelethocola excrementipullorum]|nr:hypothetical protein [Candidatus Pelethocola excrementipullorum]
MNKIRKAIRREMDVEFFACTHGVSIIFMYGFVRWLDHVQEISFAMVVGMMILGYVISWFQKLLFIKEGEYTTKEYKKRGFLWSVVPSLLLILTGEFFQWFRENVWWTGILFYGIMIIYFFMVWWFLELFYEKDTEDINILLERFKQKKKIK